LCAWRAGSGTLAAARGGSGARAGRRRAGNDAGATTCGSGDARAAAAATCKALLARGGGVGIKPAGEAVQGAPPATVLRHRRGRVRGGEPCHGGSGARVRGREAVERPAAGGVGDAGGVRARGMDRLQQRERRERGRAARNVQQPLPIAAAAGIVVVKDGGRGVRIAGEGGADVAESGGGI
jgi:hypothetical protein